MKIYKDLKQGSDKWLKQRLGKVSGTKLGTVMAGPKAQETLMFELVAETISPLEEQYQTPAMERGNYLETFAIEEYEKQTGDKVEEIGLLVKNNYHICSPDGCIFEKDKIVKGLEVKCLAAKKMLKYMTCKSFKDVYKIEKSYYWQVVNYFLVVDTMESLVFFLYNPDIYDKEMQTFSIIVTREELQNDIEKATEKLQEFKEQWDTLKINLLNKGTL